MDMNAMLYIATVICSLVSIVAAQGIYLYNFKFD